MQTLVCNRELAGHDTPTLLLDWPHTCSLFTSAQQGGHFNLALPALLNVGMLPAQHLLPQSERLMVYLLCLFVLPLII